MVALGPVYSTIPVPAVNAFLPTVSAQPIFSVPPLVIMTSPSRFPMPPIVTAPPTVSTELALKARVPVALLVAEFTTRVEQTALFISTVTVAPATIVTLSAAVGTAPPIHVPGRLQLPPVAVELILAAFRKEA